ncbi:MAG: TonB-dependent receptor [Bacteroidales bacterium]|nr:TonB-dependent receptor [Bacteroidales bacterium]MDD4670036.1 TonB-dependent receptor [Bacteroidales bacterium]
MQKIQKALILCLLFVSFGLSAQAQSSSGTKLSGTVLEQGTKVPVEFAFVVLSPSEIYATTDKNGKFEFEKVDPGKSTIKIQFVGMETIEQEINITAGKNNVFNYEMKVANFRLEEVTVVAKQSKTGNSTASNISRQAMDHLQTSSLGDLMQLLPGAAITNPTLSSATQITLRSAFDNVGTFSDYGAEMNSLGTSIVVDGSPISSNANMQALAPSIAGGSGNTLAGVDIRSISTDNIESVEVIRGVPSAEYGDLTSGAVIIRSKAGKEPLSIRLKANPNTYQLAVSKGLSLGEKAGNLNVSADYAYNNRYLYESYYYYQRFNVKGLWSKNFSNNFRTNTSLDFGLSKDTRDLNPDDLRTQTVTKGNEKTVRFNTNGTINVNKGWWNTVVYNASFSYGDKYNYHKELLSNAEALHTACLYDGAVLSNIAGQDVYDINGKKITNIPSSESSNWVKVLPYEYVSIYEILGKELNGYAQLKANFNKRVGNLNNHILIGADYRVDGNLGEGKVYDEEFPPMRSAGSTNATYRKRPYYDVPFIHQIGLFAEDSFKYSFGERNLDIKAGVRYDNINGKSAVTPRINASMFIIPKVLSVRGAWGINAKAPTALYLYPEKAYFNYNNYYYRDDNQTTLVSTNRVFDTANPDLEIAKLRKAEVGFDLRLNNRYHLSVTAFDELMNNGYTLGKDISCYQLIEYTKYEAVPDGNGGHDPQYEGTYNVFSSYAKPLNNIYSHNRGIEFELDLGRFDAIRTSFFLNGAYTQSVYRNQGNVFGTNSNLNNIEKNIAIYEKGLYTRCKDKFITTLRITHNIPDLGFVITLATQVNWMEKFWTEYGNDTMFIQYISYKDGKVYSFDPSKKDDPEFAYMFDSVSENRFIVEQYFPTVTFNLNISKEIGDRLTASFFANNMFNNRPLYESKANPGSFTELLEDNRLFFGFDLKINIK